MERRDEGADSFFSRCKISGPGEEESMIDGEFGDLKEGSGDEDVIDGDDDLTAVASTDGESGDPKEGSGEDDDDDASVGGDRDKGSDISRRRLQGFVAFMSTPEDVMVQILLWLPVLSLLRFKSVCKSWFALIQSPCFISQHLLKGKTKNNNSTILLIRDGLPSRNINRLLFLSGHEYDVSNYLDVPPHISLGEEYEETYYVDVPPYFRRVKEHLTEDWTSSYTIGLCPSCDGILCVMEPQSQEVALFNPATKQFRILPESSAPLYHNESDIFPAFGFDAKTNDYKVVKICFYRDRNDKTVWITLVEVYSLSTDSWRTLKDIVFPVSSINVHATKAYRNGISYWVASNFYTDTPDLVVKSYRSILSFDFSEEVFETMPVPLPENYKSILSLDFSDEVIGAMPSKLFGDAHYCLILAFSREKIACINEVRDFFTTEFTGIYEVWVMNEYGVKQSWTKLYTFGPFAANPKGFSQNGELLLMYNREGQLVLYNPVTQEIRNLHIRPIFRFGSLVDNYNESLLSVSM